MPALLTVAIAWAVPRVHQVGYQILWVVERSTKAFTKSMRDVNG